MSDSDYFEFGVAHDRRYTLEHLWLQLLDEKDGHLSRLTLREKESQTLDKDYSRESMIRTINEQLDKSREWVFGSE